MRYLLFICVFFLLLVKGFSARHKTVDKGFKALLQYDYFKAKSIFYSCNTKQYSYPATFGLSNIFYRHDNPFTNIDSALKYIQLTYEVYLQNKSSYTYGKLKIDSVMILSLADSITTKQFNRAKALNSIVAFDKFLGQNSIASVFLRTKVTQMRDELAFMRVSQVNKSDSTIDFMLKYPMSTFYTGAQLLLERQVYSESTIHQKPEEYIRFLSLHPNNVMVNEAYEKLFDYYRKKQSQSGLTFFVKNYTNAPQVLEAWKLLFSLSVKAFTPEELKKFLNDYPQFPLKNSILKELELNKMVLYPFQKEDFIGFINESAEVIIEAQFDQVSDFHEGLTVVSKNDTVYFINKEKINPFNQVYQDAYPFKNGMAGVKLHNKWFFINRQGQVISKNYEELNEMSNHIYVFKNNGKYGALNQYGQVLLDAKFDKLGDFKNDAAYFIYEGKYGFVTNKGKLYKEEFDWISDFDAQQLAIFKMENKYGLVNVNGKKLLQNEFDQIIKLNENYFMLLRDNLYGYYDKEGCYVSPIVYDYNKEKSIDFYCKGQSFKLLKKAEQAIMDVNGKLEVNFGLFKEINFMNSGLMLAQRKTKFGFIDKKLNMIIPFKYQMAQSFVDSLSIVKYKNEFQIINQNGVDLFVSEKTITRYVHGYFLIDDDKKTLINKRGEVVLTNITNIQEINKNLLLVIFDNGEMKLVKD